MVAVLLSASLNQVVEAEPFGGQRAISTRISGRLNLPRIYRQPYFEMVGHLLCRDSSCHTGKRWLRGVPNKTPPYPNGGGALPPSWYSIVRWGDGCTDHQEYDANTGACLSPMARPTTGLTARRRHCPPVIRSTSPPATSTRAKPTTPARPSLPCSASLVTTTAATDSGPTT